MPTDHLEILFKCRLCISKSWAGPEICISTKLSGHTNVPDLIHPLINRRIEENQEKYLCNILLFIKPFCIHHISFLSYPQHWEVGIIVPMSHMRKPKLNQRGEVICPHKSTEIASGWPPGALTPEPVLLPFDSGSHPWLNIRITCGPFKTPVAEVKSQTNDIRIPWCVTQTSLVLESTSDSTAQLRLRTVSLEQLQHQHHLGTC